MKALSFTDRLITQFDQGLRSITGTLPPATRANPAENTTETATLTAAEKKHAAALMRVNHSGEVCAQALYLGQALTAHSDKIKQELTYCAAEEMDHLYWCQYRLQQLGSHVSYLNPIWFVGSFIMGAAAGLAGDKWNLGFLAETETQVSQHLEKHLQKLPSADLPSQTIVQQMRQDEAQHAATAIYLGAAELPFPMKKAMQLVSKVMTSTTYYC